MPNALKLSDLRAVGLGPENLQDITAVTRALEDNQQVIIKVSESYDRLAKSSEKASTETLNTAAAFGAATLVLKTFERVLESVGNTIKDVYTESAKLAIDMFEQEQRLTNIFSLADARTQQLAKTLADQLAVSLILSRREANMLLASTTDLAAGLNFTDASALKFAAAVIQLGGDLASFQNIEEGTAFATDKLLRGVTGMTRNLTELRIVARKTDPQFKALVKTFEQGMTPAFIDAAVAAGTIEERHRELFKTFFVTNSLSKKQAEAMALLFMSFQQSQKAIGDMQRTANQGANTIRQFNAAVEDLKLSLGQTVLEGFQVTDMILAVTAAIRALTAIWNSFTKNEKIAIIVTVGIIGALALLAAGAISVILVLLALTGAIVVVAGAAATAGITLAGFLAAALPVAAAIAVIVGGLALFAAGFLAWAAAVGEGNTALERIGDTMSTLITGIRVWIGYLINLGTNWDIFAQKVYHIINSIGDRMMAMVYLSTGQFRKFFEMVDKANEELAKSRKLTFKWDIGGQLPTLENVAKLFGALSSKGQDLGTVKLELAPAAVEGTVEAAKIIAQGQVDPNLQTIAENTGKTVNLMEQLLSGKLPVEIANMGLVPL